MVGAGLMPPSSGVCVVCWNVSWSAVAGEVPWVAGEACRRSRCCWRRDGLVGLCVLDGPVEHAADQADIDGSRGWRPIRSCAPLALGSWAVLSIPLSGGHLD